MGRTFKTVDFIKEKKKLRQNVWVIEYGYPGVESTLASSEVAKTEIRWALDSVLKGNSNNQNSNISTLFGVMFPESRTDKLFSLGADKLRYSYNYGLAPYFRQNKKVSRN